MFGKLLAVHQDTLPNGTQATASVYQTNSRPSGRRIVLRDDAGVILFDSGDQYDIANADNRLTLWLNQLPAVV